MKRFQHIIHFIQRRYSFQHSAVVPIYQCFVLLAFFHLVKPEMEISMYNSDVFPGNSVSNVSKILGFADINGDRFTDIFYSTNEGSQLNVMLMKNGSTYGERALIQLGEDLKTRNYAIRSISLADFSGESELGVIILLNSQVNGPYDAYYFKSIEDIHNPMELNINHCFATFKQLPLIFYNNQDFIPELLAVDATNDKWRLWKMDTKNFFVGFSLDTLSSQVQSDSRNCPIYSVFFDFDMTYSSGILLTNYGHKSFQFFKRYSAGFHSLSFNQAYEEIYFPFHAVELAEPIVADWWLGGRFGILLAYCSAVNCSDGIVKLAVHNLKKKSNWEDVDILGDFRLTTKHIDNASDGCPFIANMRTMDLNGDNYPDIVTTLMDEKNNSFVGILVNEYSNGRLAFSVKQFRNINASEVIPFDFMGNGVPDLLVNHGNAMKMYKFEKNDDNDKKFLKVSVLPGWCTNESCSVRSNPFGNIEHYALPSEKPMTGVTITLKARKTNNKTVNIRGGMVSSNSYSVSQLPFYWFSISKDIEKIQYLTVAFAWGFPSICILHSVDQNLHVVLNPIRISITNKYLIRFYAVSPAGIHLMANDVASTLFNASCKPISKLLPKHEFEISSETNNRSSFLFVVVLMVLIALNMLLTMAMLRCLKRLHTLLTSKKDMKYEKLFY